MANLRGTVQGSRGEASRLGSSELSTTAATWHTKAMVHMEKDGSGGFELEEINGKSLKIVTWGPETVTPRVVEG